MIAPRIENVRARLAADQQRLIAELERAARQARRRSDERAVHDVRVATRRLDSALDLLKPLTRRRDRRRARRSLRSLRRSLGPAREVRIALQLLSARITRLPPAGRVLSARLEERLKQRLPILERRAARSCARPAIERVRRRFERVWQRAEFTDLPEDTILMAAHARLTRRATRAEAALSETLAGERAEVEALHAARLEAKRWRYLLERHAVATADDDRSDQRWLKQIQDALGEIQDLAILRERATRMCGRDDAWTGPFPAALRVLLESSEAERDVSLETFRRLIATRVRAPKPPPESATAFPRF